MLWRKFADYRAGSDFVRWACRVARLEVLAYHRHRRRLLSIFSEEVVDAVAEKVLELGETTIARADALKDCTELLSPRDRGLLDLRYQSSQSVPQIALAMHRTESAVYKSLADSRRAIRLCRAQAYDAPEAMTSPSTNPDELRELIAALREGRLTAQQAARLNAGLADDPSLREVFARYVLLQAMLELELGAGRRGGEGGSQRATSP